MDSFLNKLIESEEFKNIANTSVDLLKFYVIFEMIIAIIGIIIFIVIFGVIMYNIFKK